MNLKGCAVTDGWLAKIALKCGKRGPPFLLVCPPYSGRMSACSCRFPNGKVSRCAEPTHYLVTHLETGTRLEGVNIAGCTRVAGPGLKALAEGCPRLRAIDLTACRLVDDACVAELAFPRLESLSLRSCSHLTDVGVGSLAAGCPALVRISLASCKHVTDAGMVALVAGCPSLTDVDISGCNEVTVQGIDALAAAAPGLARLAVCGLSGLTDAGLDKVATLQHLAAIELADCPRLTPTGLAKLSAGCPRLRSVSLARSRRAVSKDALGAIATGCTMLTRIDLASCQIDDASLAAFAAASTTSMGLVEAILSGNSLLGDAGLLALTMRGCPTLRVMDLSGCKLVTDAAVAAVAARCSRITDLSLVGCKQLTDVALESIAAGLPGLTALALTNCTKLTDSGTGVLLAGCPLLVLLRLRGCNKLGDPTAVSVATFCKHMQHLDISATHGGGNLTDLGLKAVARCPLIVTLRLDGCKRISDAAIGDLAVGCRRLAAVSMVDCDNLTITGLKLLCAQCPELTSYRLKNKSAWHTDLVSTPTSEHGFPPPQAWPPVIAH